MVVMDQSVDYDKRKSAMQKVIDVTVFEHVGRNVFELSVYILTFLFNMYWVCVIREWARDNDVSTTSV
jgi:hypothetical protein